MNNARFGDLAGYWLLRGALVGPVAGATYGLALCAAYKLGAVPIVGTDPTGASAADMAGLAAFFGIAGAIVGALNGITAALFALPFSALAHRAVKSNSGHRLASVLIGLPVLGFMLGDVWFAGIPAAITGLAVGVAHYRSSRLRNRPTPAPAAAVAVAVADIAPLAP